MSEFVLELHASVTKDQLLSLMNRLTSITNKDFGLVNDHYIVMTRKEEFSVRSKALTIKSSFRNKQQFIKFNFRQWQVLEYGPPEPFKGNPVNYRSVQHLNFEKPFDTITRMGYKQSTEYVKEGIFMEFQGIRIEIFRLFESFDRKVSRKTLKYPNLWLVHMSSTCEISQINAKSIQLSQFAGYFSGICDMVRLDHVCFRSL